MIEHKHAWFLRALSDGEPLKDFEFKHQCSTGWSGTVLPLGVIYRPDEWKIRQRKVDSGSPGMAAGKWFGPIPEGTK